MRQKAIVIGAGIAGIATAIRLACKGYKVQVFEANTYPGGKLSEVRMEGFRFDAGPSLFTLPHLVDELFELAGRNAGEYFSYEVLNPICRYFFSDQSQFDADRDPQTFAETLGELSTIPPQAILDLLDHSKDLYHITSHVFLERSLHKLGTYLRKETLFSILQLHKLNAFQSMAKANKKRFQNEKVEMVFNRYATYNGSNPYVAPATLNIIPHLEHNLGAYFPKGGMYQVCKSLFQLAKDLGVLFHFSKKVDEILYDKKAIKGIRIGSENIEASLVVSNMDIVPTYRKLLPLFPAPGRTLKQARSSSALIFYWGMNKTFPQLDLHNIFFSGNYQDEFEHIWQKKSLTSDPTVYVYVSAKKCKEDAPIGKENWFTMINVPANEGQDWEQMIPKARQDIIAKMNDILNEDIEPRIICEEILDPLSIEAKTSSFRGALYGNSSNNPFAAFLRHPNFSPKLKGLYFCGGSVHPGGGIPLSLLSAKIVGDLVPDL